MRTQELFRFIQERWNVYVAKERGDPRPWTKNTILQKYRFCCMHRENDKVTRWIADQWRGPHNTDPDAWFAMTVARMFNLPSTLQAIGYPVPFRPEKIRNVVNNLKASGHTVFNGAYMIRCDCQQPGKTKVDYLVDKVFKPMWETRKEIRPSHSHDTLLSFHARLMGCYGMGSFMAAQVVADTKFTDSLRKAPDWWTWAAPGPGSTRGLNRVYAYAAITTPWKGNSWGEALAELRLAIDPLVKKADMPRLSAQDLQNCLCEFDKYERVRLGEGRPKQLYPGLG